MKKDEQAVQDSILCMDDFGDDPFDENAPELRSHQSDVIASLEVTGKSSECSRRRRKEF